MSWSVILAQDRDIKPKIWSDFNFSSIFTCDDKSAAIPSSKSKSSKCTLEKEFYSELDCSNL